MRRFTSEMAERFGKFDWSRTSIGPAARWPMKWRNAVDLILVSSFPSAVGLGPELLYVYNDAFITLGGSARHPSALGRPVREVWTEIWEPVLARRFTETLATGRPTGEADLFLPLVRNGYLEETYITFSFAALADDDGNPSGIFCTATENTGLVIAGRQLEGLRRLASHCACADTPESACRLAAQALEGQRRDVPFAIFYLLDGTGARVESLVSTGLDGIPPGIPAIGPLDPATDPWRLATAASTGTPQLITGVAGLIGRALSSREVMPQQALATPLAGGGADAPRGILVTGLNPMRPVAESRRFFELAAGQVETAISSASIRQSAERRARELAALDRAKSVFFGDVSHELRTPLTLLMEPLRQVLDCARLDPGNRELLLTAHRASSRLLKLVDSLLELSRIEGGRIGACYVPTDLGPFTADVASMFRSAFERAGIRFVIDCPSLQQPAYIDRDMWEKIVLNLLSNALKFTLEGQVSVRLRALEDCLELEVADTGCGIAAEDLPRICDRFAAIETPRVRTVERTGIGLSLAKERVRLHGGTIDARSTLGAGTAITVRIPRGMAHLPEKHVRAESSASAAGATAGPYLEEAMGWLAEESGPTPPPAVAAPGTETSPERILVVDDNADMRGYLLALLRDRWRVETAPDGIAALELMGRHPPDLVIADVMMPRMDGLELLRRIQDDATTAEIPVLLLSARAGEQASAGGLRAGASDYLVKPFSRHELLARIESRLATARRQAAERQARAQAEQTIKAREEFFAALAHELRGPAACLFAWIDRLRDDGADDSALDVLESAAHTFRRLAEDLRDVARGTSGHMRVDRQPYATLAPLIAGVLEAYEPAISHKGIILHRQLDDDSGPVEVDADRIQQIVSNLLSNAIRYTPAGGRIEVRCGRGADGVELLVRDSGRGITADALPHVFERFWQGTPALDADSGLGLGLSICRRLVELHGGRIEATSEGQDRGATFLVRLPLATRPTDDPPSRRRKHPLHTRVRDAAHTAALRAGRQAKPPFK